MNLERSIHLLDESLMNSSSKRGLLKTRDGRVKFSDDTNQSMDFDLSMTLDPTERRYLLETSTNRNNTSELFGTTFGDNSRIQEQSFVQTKQKTDQLFFQFVEVLQSRTNDSEVFETVQDLIQTCSDMIDELFDSGRRVNDKFKLEEDAWLNQERNTWRLLYCLYKDRLVNQKEGMDLDDLPLMRSEKQLVEHLYTTNSTLREYQLIVDWLEQCALEQGSIQVGHFTDRTVAWENTLDQLSNSGKTIFGSGRAVVKSLDPDAQLREKLPLHDLDMEDQTRLLKQIFLEIRQGQIEEAQLLCEHCGQPWRAALLEGWRLHHDPNYEENSTVLKAPIEGNPRRDIWKKIAWMMADSKKMDEYTRAIAGVLCGHLDSVKSLVDDSWIDLLWAYLKIQIDIRVESELQASSSKSYLPMPDSYWKQKMSLEQIFDELAGHRNDHVKNSAKNYVSIIQKYLILDDIPELMRSIDKLISEEKVTPQMLRFLTHVVLFMRQVGRNHQEDIADKVIKSYVECLIKMGDSQLVAFYTAALPQELQIILYSQFLETIEKTSDRKKCLEDATNAGLDIKTITKFTVENIRSLQNEFDEPKNFQEKITDLDEKKIKSLEWLTFYSQQKNELIYQGCALIRTFLAERKLECVRKSFEIIPQDSVQQIISNYESKENLPYREDCSIKEYLCYQTYLVAMDGYNDWIHLFHNKPKEIQSTGTGSNFTERVAMEHREQAFKAEMERWRINLSEQTQISKDLLFNILLFPDKGWMVDPESTRKDDEEEEDVENYNRNVQMENLRKLYIPEIILLLHNVLHLAGEYRECVKLADEIASESRQLYLVYAKQQHKMAELLAKITESSLALINEKFDPWGY